MQSNSTSLISSLAIVIFMGCVLLTSSGCTNEANHPTGVANSLVTTFQPRATEALDAAPSPESNPAYQNDPDSPIPSPPTSGPNPANSPEIELAPESEIQPIVTPILVPLPNDSATANAVWSQQDDFLLSLDANRQFALDVHYEFSDDGTLLAAELKNSEDELASMMHLLYTDGSSAIAVEADIVNFIIPIGTIVRLWEVRLSSPLWGEIALSTDLEFKEVAVGLDAAGRVECWMNAVRTDRTTVAGSVFSSTYEYVGTQQGLLSEDGMNIVWTDRSGVVIAAYDPPCTPEPCPEIIDLTRDSGLGSWVRVQAP